MLPDVDLLSAERITAGAKLAGSIEAAAGQERAALVREAIASVQVTSTGVRTTVRLAALGLADHVTTTVTPAELGRAKARLSLVVPGGASAVPDASLVAAVAQARSWVAQLTSGKHGSLLDLAQASGVTPAYVRQLIGAAFLAPDLVSRIVEGRQPRWLSVARLSAMLPLPSSWEDQRALFAGQN